MSQSVKLSNGNYIDAEGVWDATQGKSQSVLNKMLYARAFRLNKVKGVTTTFQVQTDTYTPLLVVDAQNHTASILWQTASSVSIDDIVGTHKWSAEFVALGKVKFILSVEWTVLHIFSASAYALCSQV